MGAMLLVSACGSAGHTLVAIPYRSDAPPRTVVLEVENATGRSLPLPQPGLIEQAVRVVAGLPDRRSSITDLFSGALAEQLGARGIRVLPAAAGPRLRLTLLDWDVRDAAAGGGAVFVSADYALVDAGGKVLWAVRQRRLPVRLSGPGLSRDDVRRAAAACVHAALDTLPAGGAPRSPSPRRTGPDAAGRH